MKKTLLTIALAVVTVLTANAQFYTGGALGFESNSKGASGPQSAFSLTPEVGYYLNDQLAVGLKVGYTFLKGQDNSKNSVFEFAPYALYSLLQFGKFEIAAIGGLFINVASVKLDGFDESASTTTFGIQAWPKVMYNLNDNIVLLANLNFASFGLSSANPEDGDAITHFGLGVDAYNAFTTGGLQVGFLYKF